MNIDIRKAREEILKQIRALEVSEEVRKIITKLALDQPVPTTYREEFEKIKDLVLITKHGNMIPQFQETGTGVGEITMIKKEAPVPA